MFPNTPEVRALIRSALREDSVSADVTTPLIINPRWIVDARIVAKQSGVICGLPFARKTFEAYDGSIRFHALVRDGQRVRRGITLVRLHGRARSVLSAERPALNAIQHLSGIATFTEAQARTLKGSPTVLYDTRKTLPGWRALQKYAVRCGGGTNHRMSLGAAILIKENHLKIARAANPRWMEDFKSRRSRHRSLPVQMEVQTPRDIKDLLRLKPERVLLDNFSPKVLRPLIRRMRAEIPGLVIELSGGIRPKHLRALSKLGADRISMGCLTHSVQAFDCSLDITHVHS